MPEIPNTEFENRLNESDFGKLGQSPSLLPGPSKPISQMSREELSASLKREGTLILNRAVNPLTPQLISPKLVDQTGRYDKQLVGWDNEDLYGSMQSNWDKAANGVLKGLTLAGTTFLQGTVGLIGGLGNVIAGNGASSFYNNDFSNWMDRINKEAENVLPNYYTAQETNAAWYSPDNLFTANFIFDKLVKNIGFSVGALYSGAIVSKGISLGMKGVGLLTEAQQAAKVVKALDDVLPATPAAARAAKFQEILTNSLPKFSASKIDRTITSFFGAATEGGIEALQGLNEFREAKIAEFQEKNFRMPNEEEMKGINDAASSLGNSRFFMNVGLLSATNYIMLPRILGNRYSTAKAIANTEAAKGSTDAIRRTATGFERALPTTKVGRAALKTYKTAGLAFSGAEAFEEGAQFVFQEGTKDYYNKKYGGDGASFLDSLYEGVSKVGSKEGMESILLGGLSGGLQQVRSNLRQRGITGTGGKQGAATEQFVSALNDTNSFKWLNDMKDAAARGVNLMQEQETYIRQGDVLNSKDKEMDLMHNYLAVRIKNGRYDLVKEDIAAFRAQASTQQGLDKLIQDGYANETDTIETFNKRLNNFEKHADNLKPTFEALYLKYGGIYADGKRVYDEKVIDQMAYAVSKIADYDSRIPELSSPLIAKGIPVQELIDKATAGTTEEFASLGKEAVTTIQGMSITVDEKADLETALRDILQMTKRRKAFLDEYDKISAFPTEYQETSETPTAPLKPTVKIKTKDGEEDIEVGVEYYLGKVTEYDKYGREVYRFPSLTILGENEDGTIKIKTSSGEIRDVSKDVLASYKLGKKSDLEKNKKAKFYFDHINDIFEFNFGKGKKQKGRLEYSQKDKILLFTYKNQYGKIKSIEVTADQFVPKKGFSQPMINKVGTLTPAQQKSLEDFAAEADARQQAKRASRLAIVQSLVDDTGKRMDEVQKMLQKKYAEFERTTEELSKLEQKIKAGELTKKNNFKSTTNKAIKAANRLSRLQESLRLEIQQLEGEQEELEFNLEYFVDMESFLDELPTDSQDFIEELNDQVLNLGILIEETGKSIIQITSLIDKVEGALETAIEWVRENIRLFQNVYPKAPLSIEREEFNAFLAANPNFLKLQPDYLKDLRDLEEQIAQVEDLDIKPNERTLNELKGSLEEILENIKDLERQYKAKEAIVEKFAAVAKEYKAQQAAEAALLANKALMDKFFYASKKSEQTSGMPVASPEEQAEEEKTNVVGRKDARKTIASLFNSTTTPSVLTRDSDKRHQRFLAKKSLLPNEKNIKGTFVTKNNEATFGLTGLIERHLREGATSVSPDEEVARFQDTLILALYIELDGGIQYFIDEDGKRLGKVGEPISSDALVYAAMPTTSLSDSFGIRYQTNNTSPEEAALWQKDWEEKRAEILSLTDRSPIEDFTISRGIPEFSDKKQYISGTLVTEKQLNDGKPIIAISTKGTIEHQGKTIPIPKGRVMIQNGSTLEFANNRNFNDQEAKTIFNVLKEFVRKANDKKDGTFDVPLMSFLQGVLLFQSPYKKVDDVVVKNEKKVARNQFYFHGGHFYFGEKEFAVPFTTASLEANETEVMGFLRGTYNNVNTTFLKYNKPFTEYNEDLSVKKEWPTYQHYLLSSEGRSVEEVPLSTTIRPVDPAIPNDRNFNSKYATFSLIKREEEAPEIVETKEEAPAATPVDTSKMSVLEKALLIIQQNIAEAKAEAAGKPGFSIASFADETDDDTTGGIFSLNDILGGTATETPEVVQPIPTGKTMTDYRKEADEEEFGEEPPFRVVGAYNYVMANVQAEKAYIEANSPFSVKTIENLIAAGNGIFAWGSYQNALITLSEKMEEGTGYHELFEGIYDAFLDKEEKARIYKEFSSRKGTFVDRETSKTVAYKDATARQAKEQMAEEFRAYKLFETLPSEIPAESWLGKFFRDLLNWVKSVFTGQIKSLDDLFGRMDSAFYKNVPFKNAPTTKLNTRITIGSFSALDTNTVVKGVVSMVFQELYQKGETKLINELDFGQQIPAKVYDQIKKRLTYYYTQTVNKDGALKPNTAYKSLIEEGVAPKDIDTMLLPIVRNIFDNWGDIVASSGEFLKTLKILQEQTVEKEGEEKDIHGRDEAYLIDAFQWDGKKNAPASVKLLIATLQESIFVDAGIPKIGEQPLKPILAIRDASTRMQKMVEYGKTFNALLDQLNSVNTLEQKEKKLRELADIVPEYVRVYTRLRAGESDSPLQDWALRIKWYNTFAKQKPIALNTYINDDGTTSIGLADNDNAAKQLSNDWLSGLKRLPSVTYKNDRYILNADQKTKDGILIIPQDTSGPKQRFKYLQILGITFSPQQIANMSAKDQSNLADAVSSLKSQITGKEVDITSLRKLGVNKPLKTIFEIFLQTQNLVPDSVFSDLNGNFRQTFVQTNAVSRASNDINNAKTREDLFADLPHLEALFSEDSYYINNILFDEEGVRLSPQLIIKYIQGIVTRDGDKNVPTDKLSKAKKLMQAINQNLNENYYILLPADSQTEWMMGMKNIFAGEITEEALTHFHNYYVTEQSLPGKSRSRIFEFLKDGLSEVEFKKQFSDFVNGEIEAQFKELNDFNVIQQKSNGKYTWNGLDKGYTERPDRKYSHNDLSIGQINSILTERTLNFMFNNIEIHKLFFGDPAVYKQPTRRYKSFLSPREQALYDTPDFDAAANEAYNQAGGVALKKGDPGYMFYSNSMKTVSLGDVFSLNEIPGYEEINGTDGQGIATLASYKQMRIKNGFRWSSKNEEDAQYAFAEDRLLMEKDKLYKYTSKALRAHDVALVSKPLQEKSRFSPLKPIVAGFNNDGPLLDKYSIAAITYKAVRGTNWAPQYKRMLDNEIGYVIYESGRKVGVKGLDSIYTKDGAPNTAPYSEWAIEEVPFKWFGIQVETGGDEKSQTWGSQTGKLNTVNLLNAGLPIDYEGDYDTWADMSEEQKLAASDVYKLIVKEKDIRVAMVEQGYRQLLDKVGISKEGTISKKKFLSLIKDELTRRELNDNLKEVLNIGEDGDFQIPLEALNNYDQIKNIIFSYVNKYISSPKVSGGAKIQVSGSGWEVAGNRIIKGKNSKGRDVYTSAGLKFYTKEEPWMEVMLPNWFARKLKNIPELKGKTEAEILEYVNNSPDAKDILSGIGFRIPTQELNSIEVFRVKAFLPEEFGDMVVVPEGLTKKGGGDFDVDKLNTYLKNVYINADGKLALVPYFGQGEEAIEKFRDLVTSGDLVTKLLNIGKSKFKVDSRTTEEVMEEMTYGPEEALEDAKDAEDLAQKMYKQSLENEYFRTLSEIISLPQNFDRLVSPNTSEDLLSLRDRLEQISGQEFGQGLTKSILSPIYMNTLRHMYISGKSNVGIAASAQTQNAISQKTAIIIDPSKISQLKDENESDFIGNAKVLLPTNTIKIKGQEYQTISKAKDRVGRYISDKISQFINGFVDIAADPFLAQLGVTRENAGTFLLLERLGVPTPTTVFFMNQPIIREYTKQLERNGMSYPFIRKMDDMPGVGIEAILQEFPTNKEIPQQFPTKGLETVLKTNINQFYNHKLTQEENAFQHLVLSEYLKYSVMASNLFRLSQATNYDTAKFSDPYLYLRKMLKTRDAETNNIFSSATNSLSSTFVGPLAKRIGDATARISNAFFKLLHKDITPYIFPVVYQLAERKKMTDIDFVKAARKVEQSFIAFLAQTSTSGANGIPLNTRIKELLIDEETSAARMLEQMKARIEAMPNNPFKILSSFITEDKASPTSTKTIKIFNKGTTAFEHNTFIAAMEELKDNPTTKELYGKLARVAFLQSGIAKSPISFTELLPVETFKQFILPAIKELSNPELMRAFIQTGTFYKNNWKDPNIVPKLKLKYEYEFHPEEGEVEIVKSTKYIPASLTAYAKLKGNTNFNAFAVSTKANEFTSDFATATIGKGKDRRVWLVKKLIDPMTGIAPTFPYTSHPSSGRFAIYYAVNPLGDGYKLQEHYSNIRQSVATNEGVKQEAELSPEEVIRAIKGEINLEIPKNVVSLPKQSAPTEEDFEAFKNQLPRKDCK